MKKTLIALALSVASASAFADPALVVHLDEGCSWFINTADFSAGAEGNTHFVLNDGDQWVLSCHGEIVAGDIPESAKVYKSTNDAPSLYCITGFGITYNVHVNFTPSGNSKFTCWGTVEE